MKEIEANKKAWGLLSKDHYESFKKSLQDNTHRFSSIIEEELGDLSGKTIVHLQCNTGADTILLARKCASVIGVDLVPDNIFYARKLAEDLGVQNVSFIESDVMEFRDSDNRKFDMVFVSEGALCWLPDLEKWAQTIGHLLKENGILYVLDSHPFFMAFDEEKLKENKLEIKYPYFDKDPELDTTIGGYASSPKDGENYGWMYKVSDLINSLVKAGLVIECFNEFDSLYYNVGGMENCNNGHYQFPFFKNKLPFSFSLKARCIRK